MECLREYFLRKTYLVERGSIEPLEKCRCVHLMHLYMCIFHGIFDTTYERRVTGVNVKEVCFAE